MDILRRNNVNVSGRLDGPAMIFSHGFGCDQNMWRLVAPQFENDYKVVLFDHVGSGASELAAYEPDKYASLDGYAADVVEVCRALELTDAIFVGHSVSSMIGVLAANQVPDVISRLVMVGPSPRYIDDDDNGYTGGFTADDIDGLLESLASNFLGWSSVMAPVIIGNPERPQLAEELTASFCRTDPDIARQFHTRPTFLSDNRADLIDLRQPALILQCSDDAIAPQVVGEYVHAHVNNSRLVLLEASGHCPNLSAPEETVSAIKNFLEVGTSTSA